MTSENRRSVLVHENFESRFYPLHTFQKVYYGVNSPLYQNNILTLQWHVFGVIIGHMTHEDGNSVKKKVLFTVFLSYDYVQASLWCHACKCHQNAINMHVLRLWIIIEKQKLVKDGIRTILSHNEFFSFRWGWR